MSDVVDLDKDLIKKLLIDNLRIETSLIFDEQSRHIYSTSILTFSEEFISSTTASVHIPNEQSN